MPKAPDPFVRHLRLKRPCGNCPFLLVGAIHLRAGRLDGIVAELLRDDHNSFSCHKTTCTGGAKRGREAMCAGAAAYLLKRNRPTIVMRVAFATGRAHPSDWDEAKALII